MSSTRLSTWRGGGLEVLATVPCLATKWLAKQLAWSLKRETWAPGKLVAMSLQLD